MYRVLLLPFVAGVINALNPDVIKNMISDVPETGELWALLVAGSEEWEDYRHQADVCHAYQVLHRHGIPDERIIVMMYDDIAFNEKNPTPGIIFNHPNGPDVYKGVPHDYTKDEVAVPVFFNVLRGNKEFVQNVGSGKVIDSGPNDHIFLYYADHGNDRILFLHHDIIRAKYFMDALKAMHDEQKYSKMVIYIEACYAGSMFEGLLPDNINIFATTASNATESSYSCYYDPSRKAWLGDVYSVKWMEDSDEEDLSKETVNKQFQLVKEETADSHVQEYGDMSIGKMMLSEFQGRKEAPPIKYPKVPLQAVKSQEVPVELLKYQLRDAVDSKERLKLEGELNKLLRNRNFAYETMVKIVQTITNNGTYSSELLNMKQKIVDSDCYYEAVDYFHEECFNLGKNSYVAEYLYILVNMCENKIPVSTVKDAMDTICTHPPIHGII